MPAIKYVGPEEAVNVGDIAFARGESVEVDAELAKRLLDQDTFARATARKTNDQDAAPAGED